MQTSFWFDLTNCKTVWSVVTKIFSALTYLKEKHQRMLEKNKFQFIFQQRVVENREKQNFRDVYA